jgi:hypothetical protein
MSAEPERPLRKRPPEALVGSATSMTGNRRGRERVGGVRHTASAARTDSFRNGSKTRRRDSRPSPHRLLPGLSVGGTLAVMPVTLDDVDMLKQYIDGVMGRADHHAQDVAAVALTLAGAIVWRKDAAADIQVMSKDGDLKNVLWVKISGQRYAFSCNHNARTIEMRKGSTHGAVLYSFSNATPLPAIEAAFRAL